MAAEVTGDWRTSSRSHANGNCLQARVAGAVQVRDSKDPDGGVLSFTPGEWQAFLGTFQTPPATVPLGRLLDQPWW
jgi:hypothetical protein